MDIGHLHFRFEGQKEPPVQRVQTEPMVMMEKPVRIVPYQDRRESLALREREVNLEHRGLQV
jgi:hypothetical protein